jgi:hypothetical protein
VLHQTRKIAIRFHSFTKLIDQPFKLSVIPVPGLVPCGWIASLKSKHKIAGSGIRHRDDALAGFPG